MGLGDAITVAGNTLLGLGTPSRKYSSPLATGVSTALGTAANAFEYRKKKKAEDNGMADRNTIESKIGVPYDFFLKLSNEAQQEILKNAGIIRGEPGIDAFGGRSLSQLETQGAPAREGTVPGGSGVFLGLPDAQVQTGPPLPPLKALSSKGRDTAVNQYLGLGGDTPDAISPVNQSLIDSRAAGGIRADKRLTSQLKTDEARRGQIAASTEALKALKISRTSKDGPVPAFMLDVARQMGVIVPRGQAVNRKDFDTLVSKFDKPVMAVVGRISDLAYGARDAELQLGKNMTDKQIEKYVLRQTVGFEAVTKDPASIGIVVNGVRRELQNLRTIPDATKGGKDNSEADSDGDGIPDHLDGDEQDYEEQDSNDSEIR